MTRRILALALLCLVPIACKSGRREDPVLRLGAEEALEQGKSLLEEEKYRKARRLLTHAFEVEPNSRSGREALLLAADAFYLDGGGPSNYIQCEAKYRDFLNRFPTSERSDYAQFQVARCLASRVEKPDRDQTVTRKALDAFVEVQRLYPGSDYAEQAAEEIVDLEDHLAAHELAVARFYANYGGGRLCQAQIGRIETLRERFPEFSGMDEALYRLGEARHTCRDVEGANQAWDELLETFPQSPYVEEVRSWRAQNASD